MILYFYITLFTYLMHTLIHNNIFHQFITYRTIKIILVLFNLYFIRLNLKKKIYVIFLYKFDNVNVIFYFFHLYKYIYTHLLFFHSHLGKKEVTFNEIFLLTYPSLKKHYPSLQYPIVSSLSFYA